MVKTEKLHNAKTIVCISLAFVLMTVLPAMAAEEAANWRSIYDNVMIWVNFAILVFLLVKFLREPLKSFLKGQRDEVAGEITEAEDKHRQIKEMITKTEQNIQESAVRFEEIKARIIEEGERTKQQIIDDAREQGHKLVELERVKADSHILRARKSFMAELVDAAAKYAQDHLPGEITSDDHDRILNRYLENINRMAG